MINVTRSSMPSYEEYCEEIKSIWDSRWLTNMGPVHNKSKEHIKRLLFSKQIYSIQEGVLVYGYTN